MRYTILLVIALVLHSCGEPEPRKPIKVKTGSFIKESVERNRQLLAAEEELIQKLIEKDSLHTYQASASGSWFYYDFQVETEGYLPQPDDLVTLTYTIMSFSNDTIYSGEETGIITYKVDKQELFPGLRNSVKLLQESETATFLFPSSLAYGYHGDNKKIGTNVPIKATITVLNIKKQQDSIQN